MTIEPYYVLNKNEGVDTLHRNPGERCNTDDAVGRSTVDPKTAEALEKGGYIRLCKHCYPAEQETAST